jgi:protein gp37
MGKITGISWTDHTFNCWWGCTKVSPACTHCYAETWAKRTGFAIWGDAAGRRLFGDKHWNEPLKWNKHAESTGIRERVFCASMADVFEDNKFVINERLRLWNLIEKTPWLDWQLLTKRPENIISMIPEQWKIKAPNNVWYGASAENQEWYDKRIHHLFKIPATVRFLSCEPLLGPIKFNPRYQVDWIITGGESGVKFRPLDLENVYLLRDQCRDKDVSFFFKQHSGRNPNELGCLLDGVEYKEFPHVAG